MPIPPSIDTGFKIEEEQLRAIDLPIEEIAIDELAHNMDIPYLERYGTDDEGEDAEAVE